MLQPLQLEDVSLRHARDIAELRDFMVKAGLSVGTARTLGDIATRLPRDRAFHRDLTSHLWVVIDRSAGQISYSDLLGVLAIAGAGMNFATDADESDTHHLLRFLMEARRSLDLLSGESVADSVAATGQSMGKFAVMFARESEAVAMASRESEASAVVPREQEAPALAVRESSAVPTTPGSAPSASVAARDSESAVLVGREVEVLPPAEYEPVFRQHPPPVRKNHTLAISLIAVCILIGAAVGLWLHLRHAAVSGNEPAPIAADTTQTPSPSTQVASQREVNSGTRYAQTTRVSPETQRHMPGRALPPDVSAAREEMPPSSQSAANVPQPAAPITRAPAPSIVPGQPAANAATATAATSRATSPANAGIPSTTLSQHLGSPYASADAYGDGSDISTGGTKYPRLLRRKLPPTSSNNDDANLVAKVDPRDIPSVSGTNTHGSSGTAPAGTVRPVSVGMMASNVLYSPAPAYPAAASAAHVQGQVKVEAEVDRNGNVASARVVSGPPLLRDAALDAVTRWRYRPYRSSGKPVAMNATAIVEFELP